MKTCDYEFEYNSEEEGYYYINEKKLQNELFQILEENCDVNKLYLDNEISEDAFFYLNEDRCNVLKWFPFLPKSRILEIGAGYGELTGFLAQKAEVLVAYEYKNERLEIIKKRCKDQSNIIFQCDDELFQNEENSFDYIVIHGIFEFARKFYKSNNANVEFLKVAKSFLNENGKIVLLTDNRLALKYFAGKAEEQTDQFFFGLDGFPEDERNRSFSKQELKNVIMQAGLCDHYWFYPYPSLEETGEIITNQALEFLYYGSLNRIGTFDNGKRFEFFNEKRMYRTLQKEGIADKFATCFLVVLGKKEQQEKCSNELEEIHYWNVSDEFEIQKQLNLLSLNGKKVWRLDRILADWIHLAVDCNLGSANPYITKIYELFQKMYDEFPKGNQQLSDFFMDEDDKIYRFESAVSKEEQQLIGSFATMVTKDVEHVKNWLMIYQWYVEEIMFYRNAERRIKMDKILQCFHLTGEDYLKLIDELDRSIFRNHNKRSPILYDYEVGGSNDSIMDHKEKSKTEQRYDFLENLHKGIVYGVK